MIAYHATPARLAEKIMTEGLDPRAPGKGGTNQWGTYFLEDPAAALAFITGLYREPTLVLEVDLTGIPTTWGDDDDDIVVQQHIDPARICIYDPA